MLLSGLAYCFLLIDDKYSIKTGVSGRIISSQEFRDPPMLFHATVTFHGVLIKIQLENGLEIEVPVEKLECNKIGKKIFLDKKVGYISQKESYENIRCK